MKEEPKTCEFCGFEETFNNRVIRYQGSWVCEGCIADYLDVLDESYKDRGYVW